MLLAVLLAATTILAEEKLFGDWAVACDNVQRCEATALMPENWYGDDAPELQLSREAGPQGEVMVSLNWPSRYLGPVAVLVDGGLVQRGVGKRDGIKLRGGAALSLVKRLVNGRKLMIVGAKNQHLAELTLTGASAALRYIDAQQGRVDGVTAIVARGASSAATVPAATAPPRIPAIRPDKGPPARFDTVAVARLRKQADCEGDEALSAMKPDFHRLDPHSTLILVPCIHGPYQSAVLLFVAHDGKISPARFDIGPGGEDPVPMMVDPDWDPETGTLDTHAKGRGLGDCGRNLEWVWDGERFRMTFANGLEACRLSGLWLTRYRATPEYR
jgi:hypothetical protein